MTVRSRGRRRQVPRARDVLNGGQDLRAVAGLEGLVQIRGDDLGVIEVIGGVEGSGLGHVVV